MSDEKDIDKLLKKFEASGDQGPDAGPDIDSTPHGEQPQQSAVQHILTPESFARSLGSLTKIIARRTDMPEMAFTDDDVADLTAALMPFQDNLDAIIKYLPYLPLAMFATGYGIRVYGGFKRKSDEKKLKTRPGSEKAKEVAKAQIEGTNGQPAGGSTPAGQPAT